MLSLGRLDLDPDWAYPYGRSYDPLRCNGAEADRNQSEATGSFELFPSFTVNVSLAERRELVELVVEHYRETASEA